MHISAAQLRGDRPVGCHVLGILTACHSPKIAWTQRLTSCGSLHSSLSLATTHAWLSGAQGQVWGPVRALSPLWSPLVGCPSQI